MDLHDIASIVIPIIGTIGGAYLKLRDHITEIKSENKMRDIIRDKMADDIKTIQRDIHNLALIIGTKRAIAEENQKGDK